MADGEALDVLQGKGALEAQGRAILLDIPPCITCKAESRGVIVGVKSPSRQSSFDVALGQLNCSRFLALAKSSLYWMSPFWGTRASEVPRETQFLLLSLPGDDAFALLLPLIDNVTFRATLRPPGDSAHGVNTLVLRIESGDDIVMADSWDGALFVCAGRDPFELIERGVAVAAQLSGGARPSAEKEVPPIVDMFGWCTWDAFYSRVSSAGIQEGLQSLAEGGVPPRFLIIDDGWQQTDVDPEHREAAARSLVSGMGHVQLAPQTAAVEEAAADLLAGTDMRQREELIGLHEMEKEILTPGPRGRALAPGEYHSLPTTPRRYWGGTAGGAAAGGGACGGMLTPQAGRAPPRGAMTSPRPLLHAVPPHVDSSPRLSAARLPPGRVVGAHGSTGSLSTEGGPPQAATPPSSKAAGGGWRSPLSGGPFGNPFRTETPPFSSSAGGGASPFAGAPPRPGMSSPQLRGEPPAPPPAPEVLAKQLQEAAAVVVQGVAPLRTSSRKLELEEGGGGGGGGAGGQAGVEAGGAGAVGTLAASMGGQAEAGQEVAPVVEPPKLGLWGQLLGLLRRAEVAVLSWLRSWLATATSGSLRMKLFSALATGPLKGSILRFYATATDHSRRLQSVKANTKFSHPDAGPEHPLNSCHGEDGLKAVVSQLKQRFGVQYVYCWHAMMGFWAGVAPGSEHTAKYSPRLVYPRPTPSILEIDPSYSWVQQVLAGVGLPRDPAPLHTDMHTFLKGCGVDGVKVDVQGSVGLVGSVAGGAATLSAEYHASLEASVARHFAGNQCINCMCGSSEDLYRMTHTNLARVSDDFYPHIVASWTSHIAHCAFNSLMCGELVLPDWDMFHSAHPAALLHATARAISGGPVYVSDRPGVHDFVVLARLVLPDGSVLRCARHARPTADCLLRDVLRDGETALKVWNMNSWCGVVGVFNIQGSAWSIAHRGFVTHDPAPRALSAHVGPADVARLPHAELYAVYRDATQELRVMRREEQMSIQLEGGGDSDIITVSPALEQAGVRFAPIGLPHMLNTGGAVVSCKIGTPAAAPATGAAEGAAKEVGPEPGTRNVTFELEVKGAGPLLAYASQRPAAVLVDEWERVFAYDSATGALTFDLAASGNMHKRVELRFAPVV